MSSNILSRKHDFSGVLHYNEMKASMPVFEMIY